MAGKSVKDGKSNPVGGKAPLKTPASRNDVGSLRGKGGCSEPTKGKDGSSAKEREVSFSFDSSDSEGFVEEKNTASSKSGGKGSAPLGSLKSGGKASSDSPPVKGGKDAKGGKSGGKGSVPTGIPKVLLEVDVKLEVDLPKDTEILLDCEAAAILDGIQGYLPSISQDPMLKMPSSFNKALQHAENGDHYTNPEPVRQVAERLKSKGIHDAEICMIARICPEAVDEVFALVPSLKAEKLKLEGPIRDALIELKKLKSVSSSSL